MQTIHGIPLVEFEVLVANKYRGKVENAKSRGIDFSLTLNEFRNILMKKRCAYTGIHLTIHRHGNPDKSDLTLERIDSKLGYMKGNVIAVCAAANSVKGVFEDPNNFLSVNDAVRMFSKIGEFARNIS